MKGLVIFFCLWSNLSVNSENLSPDRQSLMIPKYSELDNEESFAFEAIREVLVQYFSENCREIGLVAIGLAGGSAETMSDKLSRAMPENISVKLMNEIPTGGFRTPTILLFDSKQHFENIKEEEQFVSSDGVWHKHVIYVPGLQTKEIMKKFPLKPTISEVDFLVNYDGEAFDLATSFMSTAESCQPNQIKTINRYTRATQRWESPNFYPDKYKNFHGCTFEVHSDGLNKQFGESVFNEIANRLNFKMARIYHKNSEYILQKQLTYVMIQKFDKPRKETNLVMSSAYIFVPLIFVVPPGKPLTDLERMFAAFDEATWIAIGLTFGIALIAIQLIKFMPREVQNFVFGWKIRTPTLNVFSVFLIGSQHRAPGRNFARYQLMMFIMWSMIFRSCYQSMMFEHLNRDLRHPRVKTVEELIEKNLTLVRGRGYTGLLNQFSFDHKGSFHIEDGTEWFDIIPEPANKLYYIMYRCWYLEGLETSNKRKFVPSTHILEEKLANIPYVMLLRHEVPYTQAVMELSDRMLANGLIQKWDADCDFYTKEAEHYEAKVEKQVLTVRSLRFGFLVYLLMLALSFVVFLVECCCG